MNEDMIDNTRRFDPDEEPEVTGDEEPEVQVTPPPLPDVVPPIPVEPVEVQPETVVITPSTPVEVVEPAGYEPAASESAAYDAVPSPFDAAEEPGVVTPTPVMPSAGTSEPVHAAGSVVAEPPKKKNNTVLIIVIVVAVLLLLCCCCVILGFALSGSLEDVMWELDNMWLGGLGLPVLR